MFAGVGSYASPVEFTDGFVGAMVVSAGFSLLAAAVGAALPRQERAAVPLTPVAASTGGE